MKKPERQVSSNERFLHGMMPAGELGWFLAVLMMLLAQFSDAETSTKDGVVPIPVERSEKKPKKPTPGQALQPDTPKLEIRMEEDGVRHELEGKEVTHTELKSQLAGKTSVHFRVVGEVPFPEVHPYLLAVVAAGVSPLLDGELPKP